ncbi:endonuclease/exonuclease/phosphatase family protein [Aureibaculum conchae]|uniref:endonuclease/exonuclease/phosphatase family protein n=1 Tax=Aureibaculum sp. 2308TA14-22 TaxID=3108392 RepID=UPI003395FE81
MDILNKVKCLHFYISVFTLLLLVSTNVIAQTAVDSTRIFSVLSFNIYHGETVNAVKKYDLDLLAKVINDTKPDLVALQEVDFKTNRARKYDLVTELGQRTKMQAIFGKAMSYDGGEYGEGVLSKYSFLSTKNHPLIAQEGKEPRAALEVNVALKSGDTIRFVGTHLDHTKEDTDRINQARQLNELFTKDDTPTILAGDLNSRPESEAMKILFQYWKPSLPDFEPTAPANNPRSKIDYVLFRPLHKWKVLDAEIICDDMVTDHCVVLSILELLN